MKIPFTTEQFFEVIEKYNLAVFPVQLIIVLAGIAALVLLHSKMSAKNRLLGGFLGVLWIWTGIAYHLVFFTTINKAAYMFGGIFILQGVLFLFETFAGQKPEFEFKACLKDYIAYLFIVFGIIVYPVLIYSLKNSIHAVITLGLPCPSTILTFGFSMLAGNKLPKYLLIIPAIWAIIGTSAAVNFGVYPDYVMPVSAVVAIGFIVREQKR